MNWLESGKSATLRRVGKAGRIMKRSFLFTILLAIIGPTLVAAQDSITHKEYWQLVRGAYSKARGQPSRKVQLIRSTWNGKETQEEWTYIRQPPDRIHFVHVETREGKVKRTEQINIGKAIYCKRDGGNWALSESSCIGGSASGGPSNIIKEIYERDTTELNGKKVATLRNYTTYINKFSKTADTDGPSYSESKYWFNSDGLIVRFESRRGLVSKSKPDFETIETNEYDSKIKVEAPIK